MEYKDLSEQLERAQLILWFMSGLRDGTLPSHFCSLEKLKQSGEMGRAKATLEQLLKTRTMAVPEGSTAKLQVTPC